MTDAKEPLLAKLDELDARYCRIDSQIADSAIALDPNKLIALSKERGKLKNVVAQYRQYKKITSQIKDACEIIDDNAIEPDFRAMAEDELDQLQLTQNQFIKQMQNNLVMADDDAIGAVIMEIRAGTGGDEASLFARDLYNMYVKYAENKRWKVEQLDFSTTEMGGFREVVFAIKGAGVWSALGYEGGGHRVQRVPETESQGRVHTSAATVAVLPEPEDIDIDINPNDVVEHVSRAGGPGGQSVNKVNSAAIKLEHIPTGITVSMRDEKSQHKNRSKAWRILKSRIFEHHQSQLRKERESQRKTMIGSGDRSQKIRTYNYPQNRVTDHRINLSLYSLDKIMGGNLDDIVEALKKHDIEQRLQSL